MVELRLDNDERVDLPAPYVKSDPGNLILPVGDVIMYGISDLNGNEMGTSQLWWLDEAHKDAFEKACEPWVRNGLTLCYGESGRGGEFMPEVIEYEHQQRGPGMAYSPSSRGVPANIGARMVWFEIRDTEKVYKYLQKHSDIPCALRCDMLKYSRDERYREVFDKCNKYFQHYYVNKSPLNLNLTKTTKSEKEYLEDMYDL